MRSVACRILGVKPGSRFRLAGRRRWRACMLYQRQHCRCKPVGAHHARLSGRELLDAFINWQDRCFLIRDIEVRFIFACITLKTRLILRVKSRASGP